MRLMRLGKTAALVAVLAALPLLGGCWYVAAAGAGAYGGYKAKEAGYSLQSPVKKDGAKKDTTKKEAAKKQEAAKE